MFNSRSVLRLLGVFALVAGLGACLNRPLPIAPTKTEDLDPISRTQDSGSGSPNASERSRYLDELGRLLLKDSSGDSTLEELIRLLREMNEDPSANALSMSELRSLQKVLLEGDTTLLNSLRPNNPANATSSSAAPAAAFDLSYPTHCPTPTYDVKVLPSGLRVISDLPRQDACSLKLSKIYQDLLNEILMKGSSQFIYNGKEFRAASLEDFFSTLESLGFQVKTSYRTYLAPFVRLYQASGDPYLAETEIPLPLWLKPGVWTSDSKEAVLPAPHSEVFFQVSASNSEPEAQFKIYFSDKGFVFDDEDLVLPHWSGLRTLETIRPDERPRLLHLIKDLHITFEIFKSRAPKKLPAGGFGLLGVCNDGSALLMKGLVGNSFIAPFPLVRTDLIKMPSSDYPQKKLWESTLSDTSENLRIPRETMIERIHRGNPFVGKTNPFTHFEKVLELLNEENSP